MNGTLFSQIDKDGNVFYTSIAGNDKTSEFSNGKVYFLFGTSPNIREDSFGSRKESYKCFPYLIATDAKIEEALKEGSLIKFMKNELDSVDGIYAYGETGGRYGNNFYHTKDWTTIIDPEFLYILNDGNVYEPFNDAFDAQVGSKATSISQKLDYHLLFSTTDKRYLNVAFLGRDDETITNIVEVKDLTVKEFGHYRDNTKSFFKLCDGREELCDGVSSLDTNTTFGTSDTPHDINSMVSSYDENYIDIMYGDIYIERKLYESRIIRVYKDGRIVKDSFTYTSEDHAYDSIEKLDVLEDDTFPEDCLEFIGDIDINEVFRDTLEKYFESDNGLFSELLKDAMKERVETRLREMAEEIAERGFHYYWVEGESEDDDMEYEGYEAYKMRIKETKLEGHEEIKDEQDLEKFAYNALKDQVWEKVYEAFPYMKQKGEQ